jgi:hypothetical protein
MQIRKLDVLFYLGKYFFKIEEQITKRDQRELHKTNHKKDKLIIKDIKKESGTH